MSSQVFFWFLFLFILVPALLWTIGLLTSSESTSETKES